MLYNKNPLGQTLIISLEAANPEEGELRVCQFLQVSVSPGPHQALRDGQTDTKNDKGAQEQNTELLPGRHEDCNSCYVWLP